MGINAIECKRERERERSERPDRERVGRREGTRGQGMERKREMNVVRRVRK